MNIVKRLWLWWRTGTWVSREPYGYVARRKLGKHGNSSMGVPQFRAVPKRGKVRVVYSLDGSLFYLPDYCECGRFWLGTTKHPVPEEKPQHPFRGLLVVEKQTGERYARELLPFAFWKIRSGRETWEPVSADHIADYLQHEAGHQAGVRQRFDDFCAGKS